MVESKNTSLKEISNIISNRRKSFLDRLAKRRRDEKYEDFEAIIQIGRSKTEKEVDIHITPRENVTITFNKFNNRNTTELKENLYKDIELEKKEIYEPISPVPNPKRYKTAYGFRDFMDIDIEDKTYFQIAHISAHIKIRVHLAPITLKLTKCYCIGGINITSYYYLSSGIKFEDNKINLNPNFILSVS